MRDTSLIYLNGRRVELPASALFQSLSDYLRNDVGLTGTKVVCAEGDCGSCTVMVGRVINDTIVYKPVCACIAYLFQLDGTHVVTIEGLTPTGEPNAVQRAMVECHGTQCGFCTPGFVVSMCAMFEDRDRTTPLNVRRALSGNLCRCTGYETILTAAALVDASKVRGVRSIYTEAKIETDLRRATSEPLFAQHAGRTMYKPVTLEQAVAFRAQHPGCTIIAGGTDLGVVMNKGHADPKVLLITSGVTELNALRVENGAIHAGANVTLSQLEAVTETHLPEFARMLWRHGSPLTRNVGTLAGNVANGSPIGDTMPALFVLGAQVELTGTSGHRTIDINNFYTGYRQSVMRDDELITRITLPIPATGDVFKLFKISKRQDMDISGFTTAVWLRLDGQRITSARVAMGGVGATILRLSRTEALLVGQDATEHTLRRAGEIARSEIAPISDVRGSADYRLTLAQNIFLKLWHDLHPDAAAFVSSNGNGEVH